ncbi:MAG: hypothetical protein J3R72DRAFT_465805 [Linnemannia gamsii]|nr:MAG: hypothetical protein J3R72DRAFT_465805 [Linnemannia gamsii]
MSDKITRSSSKRQAVDDPTTSSTSPTSPTRPQKRNRISFSNKDTIIKSPSPPAQRPPPTLGRDKSFSHNLPTSSSSNGQDPAIPDVSSPPNDSTSISAEDTFNIARQNPTPVDFRPNTQPIIFQPIIFQPNKPITASVSGGPLQEIHLPGPSNTPDDKHSVYNRSFTIIDDDDKENSPTSSNDMVPHRVASRRHASPPPQSGSPTLSHSLGDEDHSASLASGPFNKVVPYIPFNAVLSSGFQPNINRPGAAYPSTQLIPPIQVDHVEEFAKTLFSLHMHYKRPSDGNHQVDCNIDADQQPNNTVGVNQQSAQAIEAYQQPTHAIDVNQRSTPTHETDQQPSPTLVANQQPFHTVEAYPPPPPYQTVEAYQQPCQTVDAYQQPYHNVEAQQFIPIIVANHQSTQTIEAYQQPFPTFEANQQSSTTLEANQQPNNTDRDYQQMKQTIDDLRQAKQQAAHAKQQAAHDLDALRDAVRSLAPHQQAVQTPVDPIANDISFEGLRLQFCDVHIRHMGLIVRDDWVNDRTEGSDRPERDFPSSYSDIAQDRLKALSDNFLRSSDAIAKILAL